MRRRTVLHGLVAGTLTLTAGCLADDATGDQSTDDPTPTSMSPDDADTPTDTPTDGDESTDTPDDQGTESPDGTDEGTPPPTPDGVTDQSLSVTASECGGQVDDASVSVGDSEVTVTGTIWGNDACYTAVLSDVRVEGDTLVVVVGAEREGGTDRMCAQCITEIDYEVTVAFVGDPFEGVEVRHDHGDGGSTVATADR
ncbi:hypothetical protein BRC60_02735 [Halobacteriales archaeon QH_1_68_42]|nr:MAG: hypothetical protein BRC60_02735 [Halobacteriales archaeon QH_1_68_42]